MTERDDLERLITPAGLAKLRAELDHLWRVERPAVTQEVADAAALGDRSENAEYIYGKRRLREIDKRVGWLRKRLEQVTVRDPAKISGQRVEFGAIVEVEDEDGATHRWQLVGIDEAEPSKGSISVASPIGRALLGKRVDDEVEVARPKGPWSLAITAIRRPAP